MAERREIVEIVEDRKTTPGIGSPKTINYRPLYVESEKPSVRPRGPTLSFGDAKWWVIMFTGLGGLGAFVTSIMSKDKKEPEVTCTDQLNRLSTAVDELRKCEKQLNDAEKETLSCKVDVAVCQRSAERVFGKEK